MLLHLFVMISLIVQQTLKRAARASQAENSNCTIPFHHCINDNFTVPKSNATCFFLMRFDEIVIMVPTENNITTYTIFHGNITNGTTTASTITECNFDDSHPELK